MTKIIYSSGLNNSSDADFRAWGSELDAALQNAGLVVTADSGQIDWASVVRAPASQAAGYRMYMLNDSLAASAPVFIKLEFGSLGNVTNPMCWVTVGTQTDGAGGLTGLISTRRTCFTQQNPPAGVAPTYVCVSEGFAGVGFKNGLVSSLGAMRGFGGFWVGRSVGVDGLPNGDGVTVLCAATGVTGAGPAQALSFAASVVYPTSTAYCMIAMDQSRSLVGAATQVYKHYTVLPRVRANPFLLTCVVADIGQGVSFNAAPVAGVSREYVCLGQGAAGAASVNGNSSAGGHGLAMLWE